MMLALTKSFIIKIFLQGCSLYISTFQCYSPSQTNLSYTRMGAMVTEKVKLLVALLTLQLCFAGFHIVSRLALNIGVSKVVYPVYRNLIALLLLSPLAYLLEK